MKKIILTYLVLFCGAIYGQNKISFLEIADSKINLVTNFKNYQILKIDEDTSAIGEGEKLTLIYKQEYAFELQENRLFSADYTAVIKKENGLEYKKLDELGFDGKYFLNADRSQNHQLAFSLFENQYSFYVKSSGKEFYIEPLRKFDKTASVDEYVYYEVSDIIENSLAACGNNDNLHHARNQMIQQDINCKTVELNFCVDYSLYSVYYSVNATINRTFEVLNLTQLDYSIANGLAYDVNFKLLRHYILTCPNCNYWPSTTSVPTNHNNFVQWANYTQIFDVKSDCNVFWQAYSSYDSVVFGYGALNGLTYCDPDTVSITRGCVTFAITSNNNDARATLAHELGHNFGCQHTTDGNNIMSPAGTTNHLWHPDSVTVINNTLTSSNCLSECQTELCYNKKVENLTVTIDSNNSLINVNWLSEVGMEYKLRLYTYNTNSWSTYSFVSYPQSSLALPYVNTVPCGNNFKVEIIPVCSGINGFSQLLVFPTTTSGLTPGLSFFSTIQNTVLCNNYTYTFTIHVLRPGSNPIYQWKINGINVGTNSPDFTTSALHNNDQLLCQVTSDDPCITNHTSSISHTVSVISNSPCVLSDTDFNLEDIGYYPNPVKNLFTIKSKAMMKSISVFNVIGQRLFQKNNIDAIESIIDLSDLPTATYMVKIELEGFTKTIKILKE